MDIDEYQRDSGYSVENPEAWSSELVVMGLVSEVGELSDVVKETRWMGAPPEDHREEIKEEIGDSMWYLARLAERYGLLLSECAYHNLEKNLEG